MATLTDADGKEYTGFDLLPDGTPISAVLVAAGGSYYLATPKQLLPAAATAKPTVTLQAPDTATVGAPVTLSASPAATAPATVDKVEFFNGASLIATATAAPWSVTWTPNYGSVGPRTLFALVTDTAGQQGQSEAHAVVVSPPQEAVNQKPKVTVNIPTEVATVGEPIAIEAIAEDPDGSIIRIELYNYGILLDQATTSPYTFRYTPTTTDPLFLSVKAYDNAEATTQSRGKMVTVLGVGPTPPAFNTTVNTDNPEADVVTFAAVPGAGAVDFKFNSPLPTGDPGPFTMLIFAPDGTTQLASIDATPACAGQPCAVVYNGTTYQTTFVNGNRTLA